MNYNKEPPGAEHSDNDEAIFLVLVASVRDRNRERIGEYSACLGKSNPVLVKIRRCFLCIPLEGKSLHRINLVSRGPKTRFPGPRGRR